MFVGMKESPNAYRHKTLGCPSPQDSGCMIQGGGSDRTQQRGGLPSSSLVAQDTRSHQTNSTD